MSIGRKKSPKSKTAFHLPFCLIPNALGRFIFLFLVLGGLRDFPQCKLLHSKRGSDALLGSKNRYTVGEKAHTYSGELHGKNKA